LAFERLRELFLARIDEWASEDRAVIDFLADVECGRCGMSCEKLLVRHTAYSTGRRFTPELRLAPARQ
jgi:hypothetical protein